MSLDALASSAGIALGISLVANAAQWRLMISLISMVRESTSALKDNNALLREAIDGRRR